MRNAQSGWRWTRCNAASVGDDDGKIVKWVGMSADFSRRKEAENQRELLLGELPGRLGALVNAHGLALESRWENVDLARLAEQTLRPYAGQRAEAVEIDGPSLKLDLRPALSLSLVLHELAANAVKYGALSAPTGGSPGT